MPDPRQPDLFPVGRRARKVKAPRGRDRVFDGIAVACGYDLDKPEEFDNDHIAVAAAQLRAKGVTDTQASFELIVAVGEAYKRDPVMSKCCVAGWPTPTGLSGKSWQPLVRAVRPSAKAMSEAAVARARTQQLKEQNERWWRKRWAIVQDIIAKADPVEVERIWVNLKKIKRLPKKRTMEQHLGEVADAVAPGEQTRRMEEQGN